MQIEKHLSKLKEQIYKQPSDDGHTEWAKDVINRFVPSLTNHIGSVLDVGCGSGFCSPLFEEFGIYWEGQDYFIDGSDMSSLPYEDESFDMVFARHVLEHSSMPLISLMEWARVSRRYALIVLPAPEYWQVFGKNHYYVLPKENWWNLFDVAGWKIVREEDFTTSDKLFMKYHLPEAKKEDRVWHGPPKAVEFRYLLEKKNE